MRLLVSTLAMVAAERLCAASFWLASLAQRVEPAADQAPPRDLRRT